eukprot:scaffold394223_cov32-Prasinocladus_malaysianus.AAC.1
MDKGEFVPNTIPDDFPGTYPANFLQETAGISVGQPPLDFAERWRKAVRHLMAAKPDGPEQLDEFYATAHSHGRAMSWVIMTIQPNQSFPLHAHPNIEAIYVAKGTLHELRLSGPPP